MTPADAFEGYNAAHVAEGRRPLPDGALRSNRSAFARFADWCEAEGVDPERWVRARLRVQRTGGLKVSNLIAPRYLETYRDWAEGVVIADEVMPAVDDMSYDEIVAAGLTTPTAEGVKRALRDSPSLCMTDRLAAGFNPASPICIACTAAGACALRWGRNVRSR